MPISSIGSEGSSSSSSLKVYDKKDTNKDGTVSSAEELAWNVAHPQTSAKSTATVSASTTKSSTAGAVDLSA